MKNIFSKNKSNKTVVLAASALMILTAISITLGVNTRTPTRMSVNASTINYCIPPTVSTTSVDSVYDGYLNQQTGPGWVGGDSTYHTTLPDGRTVWDFSDTLIGTASTTGQATFTGMPHNTLLIGSGSSLATDLGGSYTSPHSLIPDDTYNGQQAWYWVGATYVENGQLLVFANQITSGTFGTVTGNSVIAVFSIPAAPALPVFQKIIPIVSDPGMQWGNGYTFDSTYNYIYGVASNHQMKLARVARGKTTTLSSWQFWNGTSWVSGEQNAVVMNSTQAEAISPLPSNWGKGYIAVSVSAFPGLQLQEQFSCAPQGPWSPPQSIYTIPETNGEYPYEIAYIPNVVGYHPSGNSSLRVSYNINYTGSNGFQTLAQNINMYRARFVDLQSNGQVTGYKGFCMDDKGAVTTNGNPVQIWTCLGNSQQQWTYYPDKTLQVFGKCLNVPSGQTANGTKVSLWSCTGGTNQQWTQKSNGELVHVASGKCLTDPNSSTANGTQLQIKTCQNYGSQHWKLP